MLLWAQVSLTGFMENIFDFNLNEYIFMFFVEDFVVTQLPVYSHLQ